MGIGADVIKLMCEFRNKMAQFAGYVIDGENNHLLDERETDLYEVVLWTSCAVIFLIALAWWIVPIRIILSSLKKTKFVCKKGSDSK